MLGEAFLGFHADGKDPTDWGFAYIVIIHALNEWCL